LDDDDLRTIIFKAKAPKYNKKSDNYTFGSDVYDISIKYNEGVIFQFGDRKNESCVYANRGFLIVSSFLFI
jgi:hypothetical protein